MAIVLLQCLLIKNRRTQNGGGWELWKIYQKNKHFPFVCFCMLKCCYNNTFTSYINLKENFNHFSFSGGVQNSRDEESLIRLNKRYLAALKRRLQWMGRHENDRKVEKKMSEIMSAFESLSQISELLKSVIFGLTHSGSPMTELIW